MGILSAIRLAAGLSSPSPLSDAAMGSPWSPTMATNIVLGDLGAVAPNLPVTRAEAMSLPAFSEARDLVCCTIARFPLKAYRGADPLADQPAFLYRTDTGASPYLRMLWTVEDVALGGWSLWAVARGADGRVLDGVRVDPGRWRFNDKGQVEVDRRVVAADEVLLFGGDNEGLLTRGARTIRAAIGLEDSIASRVRSPIPVTELHATDAADALTEDEIKDLIRTYQERRRSPEGAVMYTPAGIEFRVHGQISADLAVAARNAAALDLARLWGMPGAIVDATATASESRTYQNDGQTRSWFLDQVIRRWAAPIEARLSMDDVVPRGQRVAFDFADLVGPETGASPAQED